MPSSTARRRPLAGAEAARSKEPCRPSLRHPTIVGPEAASTTSVAGEHPRRVRGPGRRRPAQPLTRVWLVIARPRRDRAVDSAIWSSMAPSWTFSVRSRRPSALGGPCGYVDDLRGFDAADTPIGLPLRRHPSLPVPSFGCRAITRHRRTERVLGPFADGPPLRSTARRAPRRPRAPAAISSTGDRDGDSSCWRAVGRREATRCGAAGPTGSRGQHPHRDRVSRPCREGSGHRHFFSSLRAVPAHDRRRTSVHLSSNGSEPSGAAGAGGCRILDLEPFLDANRQLRAGSATGWRWGGPRAPPPCSDDERCQPRRQLRVIPATRSPP